MSKWFEVEVQTLTVYAVEVDDDQNELDAIDKVDYIHSGRGKSTMTALPLPSAHLPTIKKNCDYLKPLIEECDGDQGENDDEEGR
jgi:hypothetical protein